MCVYLSYVYAREYNMVVLFLYVVSMALREAFSFKNKEEF